MLFWFFLISISYLQSKVNKEHEKRIEFIKQCLENKDNMVEFIKKSDFYNEDCFEKGMDLKKINL